MTDIVRRWFTSALRAGRAPGRWIVVDTETTGLDPDTDALLAIGAVGVDADGIRARDSFEIVLRHDGSLDAANVVVHGLGHGAVSAGVAPLDALVAFRRWAGDAPCIAFHAEFDRRVLARASRLARVAPVAGPWLDLEPLAAALEARGSNRGGRSLDDCLSAYGIDCAFRHNAASDALASAELLLRLRAMAASQGIVGFDRLRALTRQHRWLGRG